MSLNEKVPAFGYKWTVSRLSVKVNNVAQTGRMNFLF